MIDANHLFLFLKKKKINFFAGVPDSVLKSFSYILDLNKKKITNIITANEGSAVALAAGNYLSTHEPALVYMQNSGLGNAINPLISICHPKIYSIPMILMIGWRGAINANDEPQHIVKGKITTKLLDNLNIKYLDIKKKKDLKKISNLINFSKKKKVPVALLCKPGVLLGSKHK